MTFVPAPAETPFPRERVGIGSAGTIFRACATHFSLGKAVACVPAAPRDIMPILSINK